MRTPLARRVAVLAALTAVTVALYALQSTAYALFPPEADGFLFGLVIGLSVCLAVVPALYVALRQRGTGAVALALLAVSAQAQDLPRRPVFGAQIAPAPEGGVALAAITPGASAEAAGLQAGDRVTEADGAAVADVPAFLAALASAGAGAEWPLQVVRDGDEREVVVTLQEVPRLTSAEFRIEYGAVEAEGALRRTVATVPPGDGPHPAVLLIGGVGCYSLDAPSPHPYNTLRDALTRAGYATLWVEKSGIGDSQGTPCPEIDLDTEIAGYQAGLRALRARPDVGRVFLFGHSMGGLIGPLLAAEAAEAGRPVAGLVAVSTSGVPWLEYTADNLRRQLPLMGFGADQVEATVEEALRANRAVLLDGRDPAEAFAEHPSWAGLVSLPQHVSYMRQVAGYDPADVWTEAGAPALLVAAAADFATSPAEHERLRDAVVDAGGDVEYALVGDMDHYMNRVPDQAASFQAVQSGQPFQTYNTDLTDVVLGWLDAHLDR